MYSRQGSGEFVVADPNSVGLLPKKVDFIKIAPILCAGVTVYKVLKVTTHCPGRVSVTLRPL